MAKIPFLEILPGCSGMEDMCGGLQNAFVTEIVIDEKRNSMDIAAYFQQAPSASELSAIQGRISGDYGLSGVLIIPSFPKELEKEKADDAPVFGRKVKVRELTPMNELTAKSGDVAVMGEVFFTDSREVPKHDAIVFTFEMTDYTGSVRCSRFLSTDEEKAVLGKVKVGDYITVTGKMGYNKFDDDTILDFRNIWKEKKPKRMDNAVEKHIELHLHTRFSNTDALTE
ncbi:MAG: hypothetical protein IJA67_09750, partial [Oscillospiraceae bacterium]|nr:hypothetical protein [Oscillospiraceae bacterium]